MQNILINERNNYLYSQNVYVSVSGGLVAKVVILIKIQELQTLPYILIAHF